MCLYLQCAVLLYVHVLTSAVCIAALCSCADLFTYQNKIFLYVASFFQVLTQIIQFLKVLTRWKLQYLERASFMSTRITLNSKGFAGIDQMY